MAQKELKRFSLEEVKRHTAVNDVWIILFGKVVNATQYLAEHPGGMDILMAQAGKDATDEFVTRGHTDYARSIMDQYVIGALDEQSLAYVEEQRKLRLAARKFEKISNTELGKHNTRESCWLVLNGRVVDVTNYLKEHPGGEDAILPYAGRDATAAFDEQGHTKLAKRIAEEKTIGVLNTSITWAELANHRSEKDCWLAVQGKVYNVTEFMDEHPGGPSLLLGSAGRDATEEFVAQGHSANAKKQMQKYLVGDLDVNSERVVIPRASGGIKLNQILFVVLGLVIGVVMYFLLR